jgi:hypothetical protein
MPIECCASDVQTNLSARLSMMSAAGGAVVLRAALPLDGL